MKKTTPSFFAAGILFFFLAVLPGSAFTQPGIKKDTVYLTSGDIKKLIDDKYYVRVPSSDLEQKLQEKVAAVVTDKFNFIYGLIGVVSFLIGSILLFNLRSVVGSRIDKELKETHIPQLNTKITDSIADIKSSIKENFSDLDKEMDLKIENYFLKNLRKNIDEALEELKKEQQKALQAQEDFSKKSIEILKVFNETRFEKLKTNVENQRDLQKTLDSFKDLLAQADKTNDLEMISKVLNELSYVCFYLKKDAEFERLLDTYANRTDVEIKETTYVNAALGTFIDYKNTGEQVQRGKTLRYINMALRKAGDYGEAMALKLELFMVDYDSAVDDTKKELAKTEAIKMIKSIKSADIAAYEAILRFKRVQASAAKSKYIDLLYELFPEELKEIETISDNYKKAKNIA